MRQINCRLRPNLSSVKIMELQELKQKSKDELAKLLQDSREKVRQLKFDLASGKVKNVREIRQIKKDIARVLTFLANAK